MGHTNTGAEDKKVAGSGFLEVVLNLGECEVRSHQAVNNIEAAPDETLFKQDAIQLGESDVDGLT